MMLSADWIYNNSIHLVYRQKILTINKVEFLTNHKKNENGKLQIINTREK